MAELAVVQVRRNYGVYSYAAAGRDFLCIDGLQEFFDPPRNGWPQVLWVSLHDRPGKNRYEITLAGLYPSPEVTVLPCRRTRRIWEDFYFWVQQVRLDNHRDSVFLALEW